MNVEKIVLPIHFEDRSGNEFERLVLAYLSQIKIWDSIAWLGQTGDDGGRDIWAISNDESFCYQCANYQKLTFYKVKEDINKLIQGNTIPDNFIVVCGGTVTPGLRVKIVAYASTNGIKNISIWSGREFEEKIRNNSPEILKRFVEGITFPDLPSELISFAKSFSVDNDSDIIELLAECFDRPAFTTPFKQEVSIVDFEKAINDTIEVLNTGTHRLRDGTIIKIIPSRHRVVNPDLKMALADITNSVIKLRYSFTVLKSTMDIQPCSCGKQDCPVYMMSDTACETMDEIRNGIFAKLKLIKSVFYLSI